MTPVRSARLSAAAVHLMRVALAAGLAHAALLPPPDAYAQQTPAPPTPAAKRAYTGAGGYRITIPAGWDIRGENVGPFGVVLYSCADAAVNASVTIASPEGKETFGEPEAREMKELYAGISPDYHVTAEEWRDVDGVRAYVLSARYTQMGMALQNRQMMLISGGIFYTLTYTATPALFMKHLGEFEELAGSFRPGGGAPSAVVQSPGPKGGPSAAVQSPGPKGGPSAAVQSPGQNRAPAAPSPRR